MYYFNVLLFFSLLFSGWGLALDAKVSDDVEFVIVAPSYNNERFCIDHLKSIAMQSYPKWQLVYINDCSEDNTGKMVEEFIKEQGLSDKCSVIHNKKRAGGMANIYNAVSKLAPHKVVIDLDGDDRFAHADVLQQLAEVYKDKSVWMTYGNYVVEPPTVKSFCRPFPKLVMKKRLFREYDWISGAPRTHYAWLFQKIKKKDLMYKGKFFPTSWDKAYMFCMLEMASKGHVRFIPEVLYIYNYQTGINDEHIRLRVCKQMGPIIRKRKPYKALKESENPLLAKKKVDQVQKMTAAKK